MQMLLRVSDIETRMEENNKGADQTACDCLFWVLTRFSSCVPK